MYVKNKNDSAATESNGLDESRFSTLVELAPLHPYFIKKEGRKQMEKMYETPETNVKRAALNLMRHKMLMQIASGSNMPCLYYEDVNEILLVAGLPVIVPSEINKQELNVIE